MSIAKGDRLRLTRNWRGGGAVLFDGANDEDFQCMLPEDTVLVAQDDVSAMATGFVCVPESAEVIADIVPAELAARDGYTGCRFVFYTGDLGALLEPA